MGLSFWGGGSITRQNLCAWKESFIYGYICCLSNYGFCLSMVLLWKFITCFHSRTYLTTALVYFDVINYFRFFPTHDLLSSRWRDVKLRAFDNAKHRTYVDLKVTDCLALYAFISNIPHFNLPLNSLFILVLSYRLFWLLTIFYILSSFKPSPLERLGPQCLLI